MWAAPRDYIQRPAAATQIQPGHPKASLKMSTMMMMPADHIADRAHYLVQSQLRCSVMLLGSAGNRHINKVERI